MITVDARRLSVVGIDPMEIQISVRSSDGSQEIGGMIVMSSRYTELFRTSMPDCMGRYDHTMLVSQGSLPIMVRVTECVTGTPQDFPIPISADPGIPSGGSSPVPPTVACALAQQRAAITRGEMSDFCATIGFLNRLINEHRRSQASALIMAAALLAGAIVAGFFPATWGLAIALGIAAGIMAGAAITYGIIIAAYLSRRIAVTRQLDERRPLLDRAASDVRRECNPHEIYVNLNAPC